MSVGKSLSNGNLQVAIQGARIACYGASAAFGKVKSALKSA
jgi:hypothetical protein